MILDQILDDKPGKDGKRETSNRTKAGIACAVTGLVVGLMMGYSKKWNLFYAAAGGAVIGGAIGSIATPK